MLVIPMPPETPTRSVTDQAVHLLADGALACVPSASGYAFVANAYSTAGVDRLLSIRDVPNAAAMQVLVANRRMARAFAQVTDCARTVMASFWPGMVSVLLTASPTRFGRECVVLRQPSEPLLADLSSQIGPLIASRAITGGATVERLKDVKFIDVDLFIDSGRLPPSAASTILDCRFSIPTLLRPGAVSIEDFRLRDPDLYSGLVVDTPENTDMEPLDNQEDNS